LTKKSKVYNDDGVREQARILIEEYGGALVEEFIEGKEYTVLVFENQENQQEPIVLNPIEFIFKNEETFKHFDLKNINWQDMNTALLENAELSEQLIEMSKKAFICMYGTSFGRMDVRVTDRGELFFLEFNPMAKIFCPPDEMGSSDFILKHEKTTTAEKKIYHLMRIAFETHRKKQEPYHVFFRDVYGGLGIFAKRDIKKGEIIMTEEEKAKYVVSKKYAEKNFKGLMGEWFRNYAYPLSDQIWATWSDNPDDWNPVNHSCNPNIWYEEDVMTTVSMKDIKKGEELTMDYCTFLIESDLTFDCECGESCCRKRFTGKDYMIKELQEKYKGHFGIHVERKIAEMTGEK